MKEFVISAKVFLLLTIILGFIYPVSVTLVSKVFFNSLAEGSILKKGGVSVGSVLIGQNFKSERYFHGRPSATSPSPYNAAASSGSNLAPSNPSLNIAVQERICCENLTPVDLVTTSGSGLDPHISPNAAQIQIPRISEARGINPDTVQRLLAELIEGRTLGVIGEPRVNVLKLNLALDNLN